MSELTKALETWKTTKFQEQMAFRANILRFSGEKNGMFVMRSVNHSYNIGELSLIQRQGIIILIPKQNKSRQNITNYRPICLLNTIYKIASASIANRTKTVIDKLISRDQPGFISGRYIGDNTRIKVAISPPSFTQNEAVTGSLAPRPWYFCKFYFTLHSVLFDFI